LPGNRPADAAAARGRGRFSAPGRFSHRPVAPARRLRQEAANSLQNGFSAASRETGNDTARARNIEEFRHII